MANPTTPPVPTTIAGLPAATTPLGNADLFAVSQGGVTKNVSAAQLINTVAANAIAAGNGISVVASGGVSTVSLAALPSADILVGNGSNVATAVAVSGDLTLANTGAFTIANGAVTGAKTAASTIANSNLATMATNTVKANATAGTAVPTDVAMGSQTLFGVGNSGVMGAISTGACIAWGTNVFNVSLPTVTNSLSGDVTLTTQNTYYDGPSVAQGTSGVWFVSGTVTVADSGGTATFNAKLWDGTTIISTASIVASSNQSTMSLSGVIASPAGNLRISVTDATHNASGAIKFNLSGNSKDSTITAIRIN